MAKYQVKLSCEVELLVEAKDEEALWDWLLETTPEEAIEQAQKNNHILEADYNEEILSDPEYDFFEEDADVIIEEEN